MSTSELFDESIAEIERLDHKLDRACQIIADLMEHQAAPGFAVFVHFTTCSKGVTSRECDCGFLDAVNNAAIFLETMEL